MTILYIPQCIYFYNGDKITYPIFIVLYIPQCIYFYR